MNYSKSNAIGDSGENLIGFKISYLYNWVFRHSTVDIGIDGEIEIIEDFKSTGLFVKVQVKATDEEDFVKNKTLYQIEKAHMDYWIKLSIPVLLCRVFLKSQKIYCLPVREDTKTYASKSIGKVNVDFLDSTLIESDKFSSTVIDFSKAKKTKIEGNLKSLMDTLHNEMKDIPAYNNPILLIDSGYYKEKIENLFELMISIENVASTLKLGNPDFEKKLLGYNRILRMSWKTLMIDELESK